MRPLGYEYALVNGKRVTPVRYSRLFHGCDSGTAESARLRGGLPARGRNLDLIGHAEPEPGKPNDSAFRGATEFVMTPDQSGGAALWGDWVLQITDYPGYDLAALLEGKLVTPGGFRSLLMTSEQEIAIPAEVPDENVGMAGRVIRGGRGVRVHWVADWKN